MSDVKPFKPEMWTEALRSGDYRQGRRALHTIGSVDRYCCLGVLCDLAVKAGVEMRIVNNDSTYVDAACMMYDGQKAVTPDAVRAWANLMDENPSIGSTSLAVLNDSGASFERIASLIESYPEDVFLGVTS